MTRTKPITFLASGAVMPLTALAVAACGGGGAATAATTTSTSTSTPKTTRTQTAKVRVADSRLGKILVDSRGRTLYLFKADSGNQSACSGACATAWPPLRSTGKPTVGSGAQASLVGTSQRSDGAAQVTYNGHPLYLFVKDHKSDDVNGQGVTAFGAAWFAVSPAGNQISSQPSRHGGRSSSSRPAAPAAPPATKALPAPTPTPQPATPPAAKPAPKPPAPESAAPGAKPAPPVNSGIPQNNSGDGDADNNGGPSDGDGNI